MAAWAHDDRPPRWIMCAMQNARCWLPSARTSHRQAQWLPAGTDVSTALQVISWAQVAECQCQHTAALGDQTVVAHAKTAANVSAEAQHQPLVMGALEMGHIPVGFSDALQAAISSHGAVGGPSSPANVCCGISSPEHALVWWEGSSSPAGVLQYVLEQAVQPAPDAPLQPFTEVTAARLQYVMHPAPNFAALICLCMRQIWRGGRCHCEVPILDFHGQIMAFRVCAVDTLHCGGQWSAVVQVKVSPAKVFTPGRGPALRWYETPADDSGVIHYVATAGKTADWQNPVVLGMMDVSRSKR